MEQVEGLSPLIHAAKSRCLKTLVLLRAVGMEAGLGGWGVHGKEASDRVFYATAVPHSALCATATMLVMHVHIKGI